MSGLGFNYRGKNVPAVVKKTNNVQEEQVWELPADGYIQKDVAVKILRSTGVQLLMEAVREFMSNSSHPFINDKERDKWLLGRIKQIRLQYYESLK